MADRWRNPPKRYGKIEPLELLDRSAGALTFGVIAATLVAAALWWFGCPAL
jgi:hypothetical protein